MSKSRQCWEKLIMTHTYLFSITDIYFPQQAKHKWRWGEVTSIHYLIGVSESLSILLHHLLRISMSLTFSSKISSSLPKEVAVASQQTVWSIHQMVQSVPKICREINSQRWIVSWASTRKLLFGGWECVSQGY